MNGRWLTPVSQHSVDQRERGDCRGIGAQDAWPEREPDRVGRPQQGAPLVLGEPSLRPDQGAGRDAFNVVVAIAWQMTLITIPLYMIVRDMKGLGISALILLVTSGILKKTWYDELET